MKHIIKPLFRHRLMPLLVVLQVALACAIACNALFMLQQKLVPIMAPDGIGQPDHLIVATKIVSHGEPWSNTRMHATELALRAIPGVTSVSTAGSLPMVTNARFNGDAYDMDGKAHTEAAMYVGDRLVDTLGLQLVAGRDFSVAEDSVQYAGVGTDSNGPAIITRALANRMFPDGKALGQRISLGKGSGANHRTVVGVVAHLMRNDFGRGKKLNLDYTMLLPGIPNHWPIGTFGVRVAQSADPHKVMASVKQVVERTLGPGMVQGIDPDYRMYSELRDQALAKSRAAVWLLSGVCLVVLIVTMAGIMGLTGYWVAQRTRQIGIRRALGAQRRNILHYLQYENLLVVGLGVVLGLIAAYGINLWLMQHYEMSRLPWPYLPLGAALLLLLGQLAVLGPALRAARVPPVVATRSA